MDEKKCEKDLLALFISTNKKDNENKNKQKRKIESKVNEVYDTINGIDSYSDWDRKRELGYNDDEDKLNEKIIRREEKKLILERKREEKRRESRLGTLLLKREKKNLYDYLVGENKKEDKEEDKEEKNLKNIANNIFVDEVDVDEIRNKKMNIWCKMSPVDKEFAKLRAKDLYKKGIIEESSYSDLFEYYLKKDKKNLCENVKIVESEMARKNKKFVIEGESKNSNS